jgi:hypothetical protein
MNSRKKFALQATSDLSRRLLFSLVVGVCLVGSLMPAAAQVGSVTEPENPNEATSTGVQPFNVQSTYAATIPRVTGAGTQPPLGPPVDLPLPTGQGDLSFGQWLLFPQLIVNSFFDSNVHSSPTIPLSGPGLHFHPEAHAEYNSGIWFTKLYGFIDSRVYPTLDGQNTFNRQLGIIERYSPLPDLAIVAQANYDHNTNASVVQQSLPSSIVTPPPPGAESVTGAEQTVVNPNNIYTLTTNIFKQLNRAFVSVGGSLSATQFEMNPSQDFNRKSYYGSGGFWFSPILYAFGSGVQSFNNPETGASLNSFRARAGIGTGQLGLFSGMVYYGQQGSESGSGGKSGGDIYGGLITYFPSLQFNMTLSVDRTRNISSITSSQFAVGGTQLSSVATPVSSSTEITVIALKSNIVISPETHAFVVLSDTINQKIGGPSMVTSDYLATIGVRRKLSKQLSATFDYSFAAFVSPTPNSSFTRHLVQLGAVYKF